MTEGVAREQYGHYVIERTLGRGSMGTVYLARDQRIGRRVALKTVEPAKGQFEDAESLNEFYLRLQREAEVCGALHHPNVVTLYEAGYENDRISFLAMEYVEGESLLDILKRSRPTPLPLERALSFAADILRGLDVSHAKGIVHRDIKPANVLVTRDGVAKIADFGIARSQHSGMTVAGTLMGTPSYMSPEQVQGLPATPRSDLFALGILMFEMLTGGKPFTGGDINAVLYSIVHTPAPSLIERNAGLPPALEAFVHRLLAKPPEDRWMSAAAAFEELERCAGTMATASRPSAAAWPIAGLPGGEATEPILSPEASETSKSFLNRAIAPALFWTVTGVTTAALLIPSAIVLVQTNQAPPALISFQQENEFARKRARLRQASNLLTAGKYDEALKTYTIYLAQYPSSQVARTGVERAKARIAARRESSQKTKKPESLKERVKGIFRRD